MARMKNTSDYYAVKVISKTFIAKVGAFTFSEDMV